MPSTPERHWLEARATPFYISVSRDGREWLVELYDSGYTMAERLHPMLVAAAAIPEDRAAQLRTNRELLTEVAAITIDLCDGILGVRTV